VISAPTITKIPEFILPVHTGPVKIPLNLSGQA